MGVKLGRESGRLGVERDRQDGEGGLLVGEERGTAGQDRGDSWPGERGRNGLGRVERNGGGRRIRGQVMVNRRTGDMGDRQTVGTSLVCSLLISTAVNY